MIPRRADHMDSVFHVKHRIASAVDGTEVVSCGHGTAAVFHVEHEHVMHDLGTIDGNPRNSRSQQPDCG